MLGLLGAWCWDGVGAQDPADAQWSPAPKREGLAILALDTSGGWAAWLRPKAVVTVEGIQSVWLEKLRVC
jgi:hypothetical protein